MRFLSGSHDSSAVGGRILTSAIANFATPTAAIVSAPLLARSLGIVSRGELAAATAPLLLLTQVANLGIFDAATYFVASSPKIIRHLSRHVIWMLSLMGILGSFFVIGIAHFLSSDDARLGVLIALAALAILPTLLVGGVRAIASGMQMWRVVNTEKYLSAALRLGLIIIASAFDKLNLEVALVITCGVPVLSGFVYLAIAREMVALGNERMVSPIRALMGYGARVWLGATSGIVLSRIDQVLIVPLSTAAALGVYVVAVSVAELVLVVNSAVRDVSVASEAAGVNSDRLLSSGRLSFIVSILIGLLLSCAAPILIPFAFSRDFGDSVTACWVLIAAGVLGVPGSVGGAGLAGRGRPGLRSASLVVAALLNVGVLLLLVPSMGALGASVATLAGNLVAANLNLYFYWRVSGVSPLKFYAVGPSDVRTFIRFMSSIPSVHRFKV